MKKVIIPSAPFRSYESLQDLAYKCKGNTKRIQIDVCDGKYVKSVSWPFTEFARADFEKLATKNDLDVYLPQWEDLDYSVDLMSQHPEKLIPTFVAYGVNEVIVHYRSLSFGGRGSWGEILEMSKRYDLALVLAVDLKTELQDFLKFVQENSEYLAGVQVMGIENIGFQGQDFDERSLEIVKILKKTFPNLPVYFDGGINEDTLKSIQEAGVDVFCIGSYLTKSENFHDNLQYIKKMMV